MTKDDEWMQKDYDRVYLDVLKPRFSFTDFAGYEEVIEKFREMIVVPLKYPDALKRAGVKPPTGVIVWGPLGSGKGHMIEAAAGEAKVNYIIIRGRECTDHPNVIRQGFKFAREHRPCVVHLMDIDWLAPRKNADYTWGNGSEDGKPDKLGSPEVHEAVHKEVAKVAPIEDIITAASCYRIDVLDQAFTRTSMLGRKIYVPRPDERERAEIFKFYLKDVKLAKDVDFKKLADIARYYVGWDIEALCRKAKLSAVEMGKGGPAEVAMAGLSDAQKKVRAWLSPEMAKAYDRIRGEDCIHKYNF
ncbi:MAG: AAA family ATPase [Candidatus Hydrothermarchaeaceae archaeon]